MHVQKLCSAVYGVVQFLLSTCLGPAVVGTGVAADARAAHHSATCTSTPSPTDSFVNGRVRLIRGAVRGPLFFRPSLPVALVENSETCPVSSESGFRVLPDGEPWLVALVSQLVDMAAARRRPYKYHPRLSSKPSHRFRWLLPVAIAAEVRRGGRPWARCLGRMGRRKG